MAKMNLVLLDGGMGRELQRRGAPFRQPEWSALALSEAPEQVEAVHRAYIEAGAQVITSNSYAVVPFHIGEARFAAEGESLAARAGQLARQAVTASGQPARVDEVLQPLIRGLAPHVDLWLAETQSSLAEVRGIAAGLPDDGKPLWLSFTLKDEDVDEVPRLRSGEPVAEAAQLAVELGAGALLFNCSQPEVMAAALDSARETFATAGIEIPFGAYANAFPPQPEEATANDGLDPLRPDLDPPGYLSFAQDWQARGATLIGGCCGIGPEHIAVLDQRLRG